ncbi:MAG TPA: hypothetical protein VFB55_05510 [Verrucomicrobiae bacterium]|nr:hypothetical protein [Verrucomicrobiae bacterium]
MKTQIFHQTPAPAMTPTLAGLRMFFYLRQQRNPPSADVCELITGGVDLFFERHRSFQFPELFRVAGQTSAGIVAKGLVIGAAGDRGTKVIRQMNDQMHAATLPRELKGLGSTGVSKAPVRFCVNLHSENAGSARRGKVSGFQR